MAKPVARPAHTSIGPCALALLAALLSSCGSGNRTNDPAAPGPGTDPGSGNATDSGTDGASGDSTDGMPDDAGNGVQIQILSSRPETVTSGDALLRIELPAGQAVSDTVVQLNEQDVSDRFRPVEGDNALQGLLDGLPVGTNDITASVAAGPPTRLALTNHPRTGPVFSGPHQQPFYCQSESFAIFDGGPLLGQALDANCAIDTRVDYVYLKTGVGFVAFNPEEPVPADAASVTTNEGATVPYVVRLETGTLNRSIYQIAVLDNPATPGPSLDAQDPSWNRRLVYVFGGGCRGGWYRQGDSTGGVLDDKFLSQGYAVASASLNVFGHNCNDLLAAETMMMVKERFIEAYGPPRYTIGWGCSGGSYQQHQIADNYPGLLDGLLPECSFADVGFATAHTLADARLLDHYFKRSTALDWSDEQRRAVSGFGSLGSIANLANGAARIDPVPDRADGRVSAEFDPVVPSEARYEPTARPTGARATIYDHTINAYGQDPSIGFARRPLDNTGIQYGLEALNEGTISPAQFLELNERIGGFDIDANFTSARTVGDADAIANAYRTGRLLQAGGGLSSIPILDYDYYYTDLEPNGDIHMRVQHFVTRERMLKANGQADNHIMWSGGGNFSELAENGQRYNNRQRLSLARMDAWLAAIEADSASGTARDKIVRNKPADLVDGCFTRDNPPQFLAEPQVFGGPGSSSCNDLYPAFPVPRQVAGGPLANDIIKCTLKPVVLDDYTVSFTPQQQARLFGIFPEGVCDWTQPGVGQQDPAGTWLRFTAPGVYAPMGE